MKILQELNSECRIQGLSYVLIGGHAIVARGYGRTTRDLDLADLLELLRLRGLEVGSAEFRGMCEKYADGEIHERIIGFLKKR